MNSIRLNITKSSQRRQALAQSDSFGLNLTERKAVMPIRELISTLITFLVVLFLVWCIMNVFDPSQALFTNLN